jgi:hypothetical protein
MIISRSNLSEMSETELRIHVLIPLFKKMGFQDVNHYHGGSGEKGKDIIMWKEGSIRERVNYAVVVKSTKISGKATGKSSAAEVRFQVEQCFSSTYSDPVTTEAQKVHRCFVVSSKEIKKEAIEAIKGILALNNLDKVTDFINGDKLYDLIEKHLPEFTPNINEIIDNYLPEDHNQRMLNYIELAEITQKIDSDILYVIRCLTNPPNKHVILKTYNQLMKGSIKDEGLELESMIELFHDQKKISKIYDSVSQPDLQIQVEKDISEIRFLFDGKCLKVENPDLLWDCNCHTPDVKHNDKYPCKIHKDPLGNEVGKRMSHDLVRIEFDGISVFWKRSDELWPPSIDSFHMIKFLSKELGSSFFKSVLDVGSGTGFLGIWFAHHKKNVDFLSLSDWLLSPLFYSSLNSNYLKQQRNVVINYYLGLFTDWVNANQHIKRKYDVLICNPPYLPIYEGFEELLYKQTVAGTDLLKHIIEIGPIMADKVYIAFSDIALEDAHDAAQRFKCELKELGSCEVPFRVVHAFDNRKYFDKLMKANAIKIKDKSQHPYWHTVRTYQVKK